MSATQRTRSTAQQLNAGASLLAFSVLADSSLEHYRGGFCNPAMFIGPGISALTLWTALRRGTRPDESTNFHRAVFTGAVAAGVVGTGFHVYNVSRREGGLGWLNLFHAAPVAAPLGSTFSLFPTGGGVNPSLTIQALACQTGDRISELGRRGEL